MYKPYSETHPLSKGFTMITNLPNTPVNSAALLASVGVFGVVGYFIKKSSDDRQHIATMNLEAKKLDAATQATVMTHLSDKR